MTKDIFGYFERPDQTEASYDPGIDDVLCPLCLRDLGGDPTDVRTISLMLPGDTRSFFYRTHIECHEHATEQELSEIESALIDQRAEQVPR